MNQGNQSSTVITISLVTSLLTSLDLLLYEPLYLSRLYTRRKCSNNRNHYLVCHVCKIVTCVYCCSDSNRGLQLSTIDSVHCSYVTYLVTWSSTWQTGATLTVHWLLHWKTRQKRRITPRVTLTLRSLISTSWRSWKQICARIVKE